MLDTVDNDTKKCGITQNIENIRYYNRRFRICVIFFDEIFYPVYCIKET